MKYYFIIGIVLGLYLIIVSTKGLLKLKNMKIMKGIITGKHSVMGRNDQDILRVQLNINGNKIEKDLNFYSIFFKKGKKINIYYDSNNDSIDCAYGYKFSLFMGIIFLVASIFLIFKL